MRIAITGATGMLGRALATGLRARGDEVVALSRDESRGRQVLGGAIEVHAWPQPTQTPPPEAALRGSDAVVHLLGEPVAQRWTARAKREIRVSRVESTRLLAEALRRLPDGERPGVLVSQSATGYYGPSDDRPLDESASAGSDFLAAVVVGWEREAMAAATVMRVAVTRTGVVLAPSGGALGKMLPFFRLGLGGPVAGGRQYVPWIHLNDVTGAITHCIDHDTRGVVNLVAPNPATNAELTRALGRVLQRPTVLPVPAFGLRALYGEMAQIVITGQRVVPRVLEGSGYAFAQPELEPALRDVLAPS